MTNCRKELREFLLENVDRVHTLIDATTYAERYENAKKPHVPTLNINSIMDLGYGEESLPIASHSAQLETMQNQINEMHH